MLIQEKRTAPTRDALGEALVELGQEDERIVVREVDISKSIGM
jgi:transketolase C-terminal domain/subunit